MHESQVVSVFKHVIYFFISVLNSLTAWCKNLNNQHTISTWTYSCFRQINKPLVNSIHYWKFNLLNVYSFLDKNRLRMLTLRETSYTVYKKSRNIQRFDCFNVMEKKLITSGKLDLILKMKIKILHYFITSHIWVSKTPMDMHSLASFKIYRNFVFVSRVW